MKRTLTLTFSTLVMVIMVFTAATYTSCTTDKCKDISCQNGGTCTDGICSCATGFTGTLCDTVLVITPDTTTIAYKNNTHTPITITINGATQTIPVSGMGFYTGAHGSLANGMAFTLGKTATGDTSGVVYTWSGLNNSFPEADTLVLPLTIPGGFFYVKVINKSTQAIGKVYANYGLSGQTLDFVNIPNDSMSHGVGYYRAYGNSNVRLESPSKFWFDDELELDGTVNQSVTLTVQ